MYGRCMGGGFLLRYGDYCSEDRLEIIMPFFSIILFPDARNLLAVFLYFFLNVTQKTDICCTVTSLNIQCSPVVMSLAVVRKSI